MFRFAIFLTAASALLALGCDDDYRGPTADVAVADAGPDVDAGSDADSDTFVSSAVCELSFRAADDGSESFACQIPVSSMLGCDAFARCTCEAQAAIAAFSESLDVDACASAMVVPRGMITLADVCTLSGSEGARLLPEILESAAPIDGLQWLEFNAHTLELSEACDDVASFTLWGESPWTLGLSVGRLGEPLPEDPMGLAEFPIEPEALVPFDNIAAFDSATAELSVVDPARVVERIEALDGPLARRFFLFHTETRALLSGRFVTIAQSASLDVPTVEVEGLGDGNYGVFGLDDGYPARGAYVNGYDVQTLRNYFAGASKLGDAACISSCGCMSGTACREGTCRPASGCAADTDCCRGTCQQGICAGR
jgi:hypothetical protein